MNVNWYHRRAYKSLLNWKEKTNRKPLIIRGARQVGKTTLVKQFAAEYKHSVFLNLEKTSDKQLFTENDEVANVVEILQLSNNIATKDLSETLLFIDEIQEVESAISMLRYFYEEFPQLHVVAAGSLLEHRLRNISQFPVGRIEYLYLFPVNFQEYLAAIGKDLLLEQFLKIPVKKEAHSLLMKEFHNFLIIGGMPEIVQQYIKNPVIADLASVYESIWQTYKEDVEKYAENDTQKRVIRHLMDTAPFVLDQRVKFQNFGNSNYRSREVSEAFRSLDQAKVIQIIHPTTQTSLPFIPDIKKSPRLQFLDTGILNYELNIQADLLQLNDLSEAFKGAIVPHMITQELISRNTYAYEKPKFWVRDKKQSSAEVDLVLGVSGLAIPIEIKSGTTGKLRSLHEYMDRVDHPYAVRLYAGELNIHPAKTVSGKEFILLNLPYYFGALLPDYIKWFIENH